jgi:hypothetical protein
MGPKRKISRSFRLAPAAGQMRICFPSLTSKSATPFILMSERSVETAPEGPANAVMPLFVTTALAARPDSPFSQGGTSGRDLNKDINVLATALRLWHASEWYVGTRVPAAEPVKVSAALISKAAFCNKSKSLPSVIIDRDNFH